MLVFLEIIASRALANFQNYLHNDITHIRLRVANLPRRFYLRRRSDRLEQHYFDTFGTCSEVNPL